MQIGVLTLSPLTGRLLRAALAPLYTLVVFETEETLARALKGEEVGCGIGEKEDQFHLFTAQGRENFLKPLKMSHLLKALNRFMAQRPYAVGPYMFFPAHRRLEKKAASKEGRGEEIYLREKETDLLLFLVTAPQGYASRHTLLSHVWGLQPDMETRTLESHIYQLRQKLEGFPDAPRLLVNTQEGYQLRL